MRTCYLWTIVACLAVNGCSDDGGGNTNNDNSNSHSLCGDGVTSGVEECDDGADNSDSLPDACRTDCRVAHCGDNVTDAGEECDDGPQNSDVVPDACRSDCRSPRCGDGVTDLGEGEGCDCGDGSVDLPRRCSEPNSDSEGATCRTTCIPAGCGDGQLEGEELCDGALLGGGTCQQYGYYQGELACTEACSFDFSGCAEWCGDGVPNGEEACDGPPPQGETCLDYGFDYGRLECSPYCTPGFDHCGFLGWKRIPIPAGLTLTRVWFDPSGLAWVTGYDAAGGILGQHDGSQWIPITLPAGTGRLWSVWGTSASNVYAVGEGGVVLHFDGTTWSAETLSDYLYDVWGSSGNDIYVVGQTSSGTGVLWHFNGTSWTLGIGSAINYPLWAVWGSGPSDVFAVGFQGNLLHYNGSAWAHSTIPSGDLKAVWGTSASDVFVGGLLGIYHFNGSQWVSMPLPASSGRFTGLWGTAPDNVFAVGEGPSFDGVLLHYDGALWREFDTGYIGAHRAIGGASSTYVLTVGDGSRMRRFSGLGWTLLDLTSLNQTHPLAIWGAAPDALFVAGQGAEPLYRYSAAGWAPLCPGYQYCLSMNAIWGSGPNNVYFVGGEDSNCGDQVVHYMGSSCGSTTLTVDWANSVFGTGPADVWVGASGGSNTLSHYTTVWSTVSAVSGELYAVWASADGQVFAVGNYGTIWHLQGGSWTSTALPSDDSLLSLWGSGSSDVYAVGGPGKVTHFDGATWASVPVPTSETLNAVWGTSASDVYVVGAWGTVLHFDGEEWAPIRATHGDDFRYVWGIGKVVYFVRTSAVSSIDALLDAR